MQGLLHQTQGLILVTGPTGSGKSMTLARCLLDLARDDRHVATVEDPIEFELPGVHQVQLNRARALDFPTSLRALLRQDPDVIMIGEIRDQETAHIAIQAAETGHLVLATVHTKRAQDAEKRLAHFGIAPTHLNTVLKQVIAQRLIRTLCEICHGQGCGECQGGYRGRTGLFEMFSPNQTTHPAEEDYRDSIAHHLAHQRTTPEEIHRVLGFEIVSHTLD
jgi:type II secretory ATPase GspE/PulE/Tfp pilus assembly ATPase PilB-like protein